MGGGQRPYLVALRIGKETIYSTNSRAKCELAQEVRCVRIEASKFCLITLSSLAITMRSSWQLPVEFPLCYVVLTMGTASGRVEYLSCWYGTSRSINGSSTTSPIPVRELYGPGDEIDRTILQWR